MTPYRVIFESPLELSAQGERWAARRGVACPRGGGWHALGGWCPRGRGAGRGPGGGAERALAPPASGKQMIETYFDFRLYRLWKSRQHSKLLDFEDVL